VWGAVLATDGVTAVPASETAGAGDGAAGVILAGVGDPVAFGDSLISLGCEFVVVVVPSALATRALTALTLAAGRWPSLRTARVISDHMPVALQASLGAARAATRDAGVAVGYVETFLAMSWSGAWSRSVAKLARPTPSFAQHLRSLLPGGFLVSSAPRPAVFSRITSDIFPSAPVERLLLVQEPGVSQPVAERLAQVSGAVTVRPVPVPGSWTAVMGARHATQLGLIPTHPLRVRSEPIGGCDSCGSLIASPVCPFCHVIGRPLAAGVEAR
jgi:hypothetical protein